MSELSCKVVLEIIYAGNMTGMYHKYNNIPNRWERRILL